MFNARKPGGAPPAGGSGGAGQKRQAYRATIEFPVLYEVEGRSGTRTALANDLSVGGLRLIGDEDFGKTQQISLRFTPPVQALGDIYIEKEVTERTVFGEQKKRVKVPPTPFEELDIGGNAVITFYDIESRKLIHGFRFMGLPTRIEDELQRFVHLVQLKQLRDRSETNVVEPPKT